MSIPEYGDPAYTLARQRGAVRLDSAQHPLASADANAFSAGMAGDLFASIWRDTSSPSAGFIAVTKANPDGTVTVGPLLEFSAAVDSMIVRKLHWIDESTLLLEGSVSSGGTSDFMARIYRVEADLSLVLVDELLSTTFPVLQKVTFNSMRAEVFGVEKVTGQPTYRTFVIPVSPEGFGAEEQPGEATMVTGSFEPNSTYRPLPLDENRYLFVLDARSGSDPSYRAAAYDAEANSFAAVSATETFGQILENWTLDRVPGKVLIRRGGISPIELVRVEVDGSGTVEGQWEPLQFEQAFTERFDIPADYVAETGAQMSYFWPMWGKDGRVNVHCRFYDEAWETNYPVVLYARDIFGQTARFEALHHELDEDPTYAIGPDNLGETSTGRLLAQTGTYDPETWRPASMGIGQVGPPQVRKGVVTPDTHQKVIRFTAGPAIEPPEPPSHEWTDVDLSSVFIYDYNGTPTGKYENGAIVSNASGWPEFSLPGFTLEPGVAYEFEFTYRDLGQPVHTVAYGITEVDQTVHDNVFGYDNEFFSYHDSDGSLTSTYVIGPGRGGYDPALAAGEDHPLFYLYDNGSELTGMRWRPLPTPAWNEFDLTDAVIYTTGGSPTGEVVNGTIVGYDAGGGVRRHPDFGFPGFALTPGVAYEFEFTYEAPVAYGEAGSYLWGATAEGQAAYDASNSSAHQFFFDYGGEVQVHAAQPGRYNYDAAMTAGAVYPVFESEADAVLTRLRWRDKAEVLEEPEPDPIPTTLTLKGPETAEQGDYEKHRGLFAIDPTNRSIWARAVAGCDDMDVWIQPQVDYVGFSGQDPVLLASETYSTVKVSRGTQWHDITIKTHVANGEASHARITLRMYADAERTQRLPEGTEVYFDSLYVTDNGLDPTDFDKPDHLSGDEQGAKWEREKQNSTSVYGQTGVAFQTVVLGDGLVITAAQTVGGEEA